MLPRPGDQLRQASRGVYSGTTYVGRLGVPLGSYLLRGGPPGLLVAPLPAPVGHRGLRGPDRRSRITLDILGQRDQAQRVHAGGYSG